MYKTVFIFKCKKGMCENPITRELAKQADIIKKRELEIHTINAPEFITWKEYSTFKQAMYNVRLNETDSTEKDDFIVQANSLMKLFVTAVFSMSKIEEMILHDKIEIESQKKDKSA